MTNKDKGNSGLGMAIAYFSTNGYTVSIPLNDTQDYDLVVEKDKRLNTVQVKSTSFKTKYGIYQVSLKSSGGTSGKIYKTVIDTNVDLLFVLTKDSDTYLMPIKELKNTSTLNLNENYEKWRIKI
ncbi:MAG: group I intron-associated PD-(D/E)XK endonuclease [Oscillospiraceae bacterium]|nr:group I intron-associated PD-(D/E)XK endonuclease [Oscillospiraceae bacterium]